MASKALNQRITIQKLNKPTTGDNGFELPDWDDYKTVWASINNLWGKEFWAAKAVQAESTVEFIVRYSADMAVVNSKEYQIIWNDRIFNIICPPDNIQYKNQWIKFRGLAVE